MKIQPYQRLFILNEHTNEVALYNSDKISRLYPINKNCHELIYQFNCSHAEEKTLFSKLHTYLLMNDFEFLIEKITSNQYFLNIIWRSEQRKKFMKVNSDYTKKLA